MIALYRFTSADGKPNHYTDTLVSAARGNASTEAALRRLEPGDRATFANGTWERVA